MMDDEKDSNRARVTKGTIAEIEWRGRMDNTSEGGGGGGGGPWLRNIGDEAEDEKAQPPWEFDDEELMEEIHVVMGVGSGAATAVADAVDPHQRDANVNCDPDGGEDRDVNNDDDEDHAACTADALFHGECNNQRRLM
jgi:hypothetical protein